MKSLLKTPDLYPFNFMKSVFGCHSGVRLDNADWDAEDKTIAYFRGGDII